MSRPVQTMYNYLLYLLSLFSCAVIRILATSSVYNNNLMISDY